MFSEGYHQSRNVARIIVDVHIYSDSTSTCMWIHRAYYRGVGKLQILGGHHHNNLTV